MPDRDSVAAHVERAYRAYAADPRKRRKWAADNPGNVAIREELLDKICEVAAAELTGNGAILDAGCGSGWLLEAMVERGVAPTRLHGIDLLEHRVEAARARVPAATVRQGDCTALPYPNASFSLVVMVTMLSSLPTAAHVTRALQEARRVLVPGGLLVSYEPRVPTLNRRTRLIKRSDYRRVAWAAEQLVSLTVAPPVARWLGRTAPRLYPLFARLRLAHTHRVAVLLCPRDGSPD